VRKGTRVHPLLFRRFLVVASAVANPPIPLRDLNHLGLNAALVPFLCFINRLEGDTPDLLSRGVLKMGVASGGQFLAECLGPPPNFSQSDEIPLKTGQPTNASN
jgi:hypothetical protein